MKTQPQHSEKYKYVLPAVAVESNLICLLKCCGCLYCLLLLYICACYNSSLLSTIYYKCHMYHYWFNDEMDVQSVCTNFKLKY